MLIPGDCRKETSVSGTSVPYDMPEEIRVSRELADRIKLASEFTIERPTLLEPGFYVVILGELRKPVYLEASPSDASS